MERLTRRINNNKITAIKGSGCNYSVHSFDCQINEGREKLRMALEKLAAYEDAEEQGLLVRLPVKIKRYISSLLDGQSAQNVVQDLTNTVVLVVNTNAIVKKNIMCVQLIFHL